MFALRKKLRTDNSLIRQTKRWAPLFMGPVVAAFAIGFIWPFIQGIYLSFCKFRLIRDAKFIGFGNYLKALQDASFRHAFWYTALFAIVSLVIINVLAFTVAYVLTQGIKGSNLFRTVFFMPNLMESRYGFFFFFILVAWQQIGYMMIIYIAGLQAVPEDMLEAAKIDGANRTQTLFRVTIPNVMPSITICTFLGLTNGFKLFDQNLALTAGQPFIIQPDGSSIKTTEMLALNIYSTFFNSKSSSTGVAQAKAVLFFILVAGLGLLQLGYTRKREVQQ